MLTKHGICYDLDKSPYKLTKNDLTFVFSSQSHLDKFLTKIKEHRETINNSLTKRFNVYIDVSQLADIVLYKKVETRGFLIVNSKGIEICENNLTYVGGNVTTKKSTVL